MNERTQQELDELESFLFRIDETESPDTGGFMIDTPDKAAWAGRKIVEAETRISSQKSIADEYKRRIDEWFERTIKEDKSSIEYLTNMLKPFAFGEIKSLKKGKTLKYFGVTISMRKLPDKLEINDEQKAVKFCSRNLKSAVEIKKILMKAELKRAIADGMAIPGVSTIPGTEEIYISGEADLLQRNVHTAA